jgi:Mg/Co/Ni transporter MgtE
VFILINNFLFAFDAFEFATGSDSKVLMLERLLILLCKFAMLLMFTCALVMGSLIPLALMYVILSPATAKSPSKL